MEISKLKFQDGRSIEIKISDSENSKMVVSGTSSGSNAKCLVSCFRDRTVDPESAFRSYDKHFPVVIKIKGK